VVALTTASVETSRAPKDEFTAAKDLAVRRRIDMAGAASIWLCAGLPCPDAPGLLPRLGCERLKIRLLKGSADLIERHVAVGMAVEIGHESPAVAVA